MGATIHIRSWSMQSSKYDMLNISLFSELFVAFSFSFFQDYFRQKGKFLSVNMFLTVTKLFWAENHIITSQHNNGGRRQRLSRFCFITFALSIGFHFSHLHFLLDFTFTFHNCIFYSNIFVLFIFACFIKIFSYLYFLLDFTFHICCFLNLFTFFFVAFLPISYEMSVCWNVFSFCERRTLEIHLSSERHKSSENLKPTTIQKMKAAATYLSVLPQQRRNHLSKYK